MQGLGWELSLLTNEDRLISNAHLGGGRKCRYCESAGTVCSTNNAPRKRPFYRVSEEEYNSCMKLLRHFIPDTDFNLETLKRILAQVEDQKPVPPITSTNINRKTTIDRPQLVESRDDVQDKPPESDDSSISLEDTGCMIIDPSGKYRPCSFYNTQLSEAQNADNF